MISANPDPRYIRDVRTGEVLFVEGEAGDVMYVIRKGRVRITRLIRGRQRLVAELNAGEFFGELAIVNNKPRSGTATVVEDGELLVLDATTFVAMVRANTEIAVRMLMKMAERLDRANHMIQEVIVREANNRVLYTLLASARLRGEESIDGVLVRLSPLELCKLTGVDEGTVQFTLERLAGTGLLRHRPEGFELNDPDQLEQHLELLDRRGGAD